MALYIRTLFQLNLTAPASCCLCGFSVSFPNSTVHRPQRFSLGSPGKHLRKHQFGLQGGGENLTLCSVVLDVAPACFWQLQWAFSGVKNSGKFEMDSTEFKVGHFVEIDVWIIMGVHRCVVYWNDFAFRVVFVSWFRNRPCLSAFYM